MKSILFCLALALASTAQAGLIVNPANTDLTPFGFGTAPAILTLQGNPLEQGCVAPIDTIGGYSTNCGPSGSLVSGNNKYAAPTLASLGVTSFATLGILLNINDPGSTQQATLQNLMLTLYGGTDGTTGLFHFSLVDPYVDLAGIAMGQGKAGFLITIASDQIPATGFSDALRVGLSATIGCTVPVAGCNVAGQFSTGGGPDSFTVANLGGEVPQETVPEPATAALLGGGLLALAWALRRRKAS